MAPITKTLALAGALYSAFGFAAPVDKRAVVWETVTDIVWTTIDVTTTLYPEQLDAATATVVPVTTTAPVVAAVTTTAAARAAQVEKQPAQVEEQPAEAKTTSTSTSSTSTATPAPAPTEQTTQAPAPVETTSSAAPTTTEAAPAAASSSTTESTASSSSSGYSGSCSEGSPCTGQMTYYDTATSSSNPSSCGTTNDGETELVLALPVGIMTDGDCGKTVTIEYNGVTKTGTVVDKCMGCDNGSVDLSRAFFEAFASLSEGRLSDATWYIN
ncbi:Allergen Asp f 7 [Penicillium atrosanguineum]|uniref:Allergen Asp f 7 n=1 Tax=Penicillium atrosanguineum TaxID=1132637 RepID=A0A9W9Q5T8_9EURO|nr:Allergen Asp f 7 [Penicillium atrosanguineum]